jgi:general secretion pathway protein G
MRAGSESHAIGRLEPGFTLIELLVVMAIVATLLSIVAPRYFHSVDRSKEATLRADLRELRDVIDKHYGDTGSYPESLDVLVQKKYIRAVPEDPITGSSATWVPVPYPDGSKQGVYDVHSGATGNSADGSAYARW